MREMKDQRNNLEISLKYFLSKLNFKYYVIGERFKTQ